MKSKKPSFAEGIRMLNTRGALVLPCRLTKARARLLIEFIGEFKDNWYTNHDNPDKKQEDDMQFAMQWILNQVNKRWSQNELYADSKRK